MFYYEDLNHMNFSSVKELFFKSPKGFFREMIQSEEIDF